MRGLSVHIVILLAFGIKNSLQTQECQINSGALRGNRGAVLSASCPEGDIYWNLPRGSLSINFPRTTVATLTQHPRRKMKVCFRGRDLGGSVTSITHIYARRGQNLTRDIQLDTDDSETNWVCSRPSRHSNGVHVVLGSVPEWDIENHTYLAIVEYKAEQVRSRRRGGRRGGL